MEKIKIKQVRSRIGRPKDQKRTLDALGLNKINKVVEHNATPQIMGMVNKVVTHSDIEKEALEWGRIIKTKSPTAMRMLKYGFNLPDDGLVGQQLFAGEATRLAYGTEEAKEGRNAFIEKRDKQFEQFDWQY